MPIRAITPTQKEKGQFREHRWFCGALCFGFYHAAKPVTKEERFTEIHDVVSGAKSDYTQCHQCKRPINEVVAGRRDFTTVRPMLDTALE